MSETTLADLERRGELEIGEVVELGGGLYIARGDTPRWIAHGLYFVGRRRPGRLTHFLHQHGTWAHSRATTRWLLSSRPLRLTKREDLPGYFDDLPTLLDRLAATLYAEADSADVI